MSNYPHPDDIAIAECLKELREQREAKERATPPVPVSVVCPCCDGDETHRLDSDPDCDSDDFIYCDEEQGEDRVCRHRWGKHHPVALRCATCHGHGVVSTESDS